MKDAFKARFDLNKEEFEAVMSIRHRNRQGNYINVGGYRMFGDDDELIELIDEQLNALLTIYIMSGKIVNYDISKTGAYVNFINDGEYLLIVGDRKYKLDFISFRNNTLYFKDDEKENRKKATVSEIVEFFKYIIAYFDARGK